MTSRAPFDLTAALPLGRTVIEASAGTGKTYSLTALIVRYIAEAGVAVDQFLVVTFTRAAANDLRDRTRDVLLRALHAVTTNTVPDGHPWMSVLLASPESPAEQSSRLQRLAGAVNHFDELTITTIHGYCQQALVQLGVRAAIDPDAMLVENTHDIVAEVCRDIIVTELADQPSLLNSPRGSERKVTTPAQAEAQLIANVTTLLTNPGVVHAPPSSFDSSGRLIVGDGQPTAMDEMAARWIQLTRSAFEQVSARQILRNEIGYDSLISGVRDALADPRTGHAIAAQLAQRSTVVLVDEFQDTDRVQWDVFQRAFASKTLITVGDPKQAIYRFRGADVHAYLDAVDRQSVLTLDTNHRSDRRVLAGLERLLDGASLGDPRIRFAPVRARSSAPDSALGARSPTIGPKSGTSAAIQLRVAPLDPALRAGQQRDLSMPLVRTLVLADLTRRIIDLLDNGFISPGDGDVDGHDNAVRPGDIAVLVPSHAEANNVAEALRRAGIPAVRTRTGSVMQTPAAGQWRLLLAALAQPHDAPVVRAAALGWFLPTDIRSLAGSDDVLVALHEHVARMADRLRLVGISAFYDEQKSVGSANIWGCGVAEFILGREGGDRHLTDLDHIAELLAAATLGRQCDPAHVLRTLDDLITSSDERSEASMRRIDSDSLAVQITTIHSAKGLEYPIVMIPFGFKPRANVRNPLSYTGPDGQRTVDIASSVGWDAGCRQPGDETTRNNQVARKEWAMMDIEGDELRLLYVALTRAVHRVELWWASTLRATNSSLGRILLDRDGASPIENTPVRFEAKMTKTGRPSTGINPVRPPYQAMSETDVVAQIGRLANESNNTIEIVQLPAHLDAPVWSSRIPAPADELHTAAVTPGGRAGSFSWNRWSFSRLGAQLEAAEPAEFDSGGHDEPVNPADDLAFGPASAIDGSASAPAAALADVAGGTRFGTFVHAVLEHVDFSSPDLENHVRAVVVEHSIREGLAIAVDPVVKGLVAALRTPLGPLFDQLSLSRIPTTDRLDELTFDLPLIAGRPNSGFSAGLIGETLIDTLSPDDPMRPFAAQLAGEMATLDISGWMHGSIDAVVRAPGASGDRYFVIDYKTNRLHPTGSPDPLAAYRPDRLIPAMEHSRYPLQALIYIVATHRYLRWRLGSAYSPEHHLGGVGYLFVRGMVGPDTPSVGGVPHGVCCWKPAAAAVLAVDQLFATGSRP